jgi:hypothetical protein
MEKLLWLQKWSFVLVERLRSVFLLALFSTLSLPWCSQDSLSDDISLWDTESLKKNISSPVLDATLAKDKSILYYHIARDKYGRFDVCDRVMRVISLTPRIYAAWESIGMSPEMQEYFRAQIFVESGGDSLAVSVAWATWVAQFLKSTAWYYGWYKVVNGHVYDKRTDISWSLQAAAKMHQSHYKTLWDRSLAFASYHMWIGNMKKLRALYADATWESLDSFDQLYDAMPPQQVIDWLNTKNDDTFSYWIKIRNAVTLLRLYEQDPDYFDYLESLYRWLSYDIRGVIAAQLIFSEDDYLATHDDVYAAIQSGLLQELDHEGFVCGYYDFENFLAPDVQYILADIRTMYGKDIRIDCGFLPMNLVWDSSVLINNQQKLRLGTHSTWRSFDVNAPTNTVKAGKITWSSDYNRLEMVLTLLRYQGKIVWCNELDPTGKKVIHFHVTVL